MDHVSPSLSSDLTLIKSAKNYLSITKPGIIVGNLVSVLGGFLFASRGQVDSTLLYSTLLGVALVIASSCALNNMLDSDIDLLMSRTRNRAFANGLISPNSAALFALIQGAVGISILWVSTNILVVAIVLVGLLIYVCVYTPLKRSSTYAPLIGSFAGAAPPLAGYCAVTGQFDMGALILLVIFSLWQMPHFYAIAIYRLEDYRRASIPVLPVTRGIAVTRRHILGYIIAFVIASLSLTFAGYTGYWYFAVMLVMGAIWFLLAFAGYQHSTERIWAKRLFFISIAIVFVTNIMISIDYIVPKAM